MSIFNDDLEMPKFSKNSSKTTKMPITIFLKPGDYRFRLLKYTLSSKNDRDYPFIERHIHDHWSVNDKGYKLPDDTVVCLKTHYINHQGNRKEDCPMCRAADEAMAQWKASGFKDPVSAQKFNAMKSKYQAIIPVYVVKDSNNPKNEGHMKCFMLTENKRPDKTTKKYIPELDNPSYITCYNDFHSAVQAKISEIISTGGGYSIWNGKNAVDVCLRVSDVPVVYNRGKANEFKTTKRVITKMLFSTKPYDIEGINKKTIETFQFDDQYYVKSTVEDIENFLNRNYSSVVQNIPDEDIDMGDDSPIEQVKVSPVQAKQETAPDVTANIDDIDISDIDNITPVETQNGHVVSEQSNGDIGQEVDTKIDDLLSDMDNI